MEVLKTIILDPYLPRKVWCLERAHFTTDKYGDCDSLEDASFGSLSHQEGAVVLKELIRGYCHLGKI